MFTLQLLADQPPPPGNPFDRPEIIWATVGIAAALIVGAVVVMMVDRWRKKGLAESGRSVDELTEYRRMFDAGEITEEEYKKLRQQLADRVKLAPAAPNPDAGPVLVNGLPRVVPKPSPVEETKPWDKTRTESDPPA